MTTWSIALWLAVAPPATEPTSPSPGIELQPLGIEGEVSDVWRARFSERVVAGLRSDVEPSPPWVVQVRVVNDEGNYQLELRAQRAGAGDLRAAITTSCELCGEGEVADRLQTHAAKLRAQIDAAAGTPARLSLRTRPPGASVELDGGPAGATPVELEVDEGEHRLRFELDGYEDARLVVESVAGLTVSRDIDLVPLATPTRERTPAHWVGIGLTATGGAALITGAVLMALHAREVRTPCEADADGDCRQLFNTRVPGAVVLGTGVAAAVVGAGLWIHSARRRRARSGQRGASR